MGVQTAQPLWKTTQGFLENEERIRHTARRAPFRPSARKTREPRSTNIHAPRCSQRHCSRRPRQGNKRDACTKERHTRTTAGCSSLKTRYFHSRRTFQAQPTEEKTLHFLLESIRREQLNQVWTGYICLPELRYRLAIVVMTPPLAKKWTPKQPEISEDVFTGHRMMSNFKRDARTCSP